MSQCVKPMTASFTVSPVWCHILFLIPIVLKTVPDSATKKKMFQELDHWFVQDFTPIWNWKWLCNKMASTGKAFRCVCNLKKSLWCLSCKISHLHLPWKTTLLERTDRQAWLIQTSDTGTWQVGFCVFFFLTEWNKVSLQGKQTTLFFFLLIIKFKASKKYKF